MATVKILNFYNRYINKVITLYYILESIDGLVKNNLFNEALNLMELGFGEKHSSCLEPTSPGETRRHWIDDETRDIENNKPLSLIHPEDCV